jgi:hypothetical protein
MVLLDATAFSLLVNPDAKAPIDPKTGKAVINARERFVFLKSKIEKSNSTIIIPTPALAEVLVSVGDAAPAVMDLLSRSARFRIAHFDALAAVELAAMTREALRAGDKKQGSSEPWQKVKIDRQIIAIARMNQVNIIYSDDQGVKHFAGLIGMQVVQTWEMPLPPMDPQGKLSLGEELKDETAKPQLPVDPLSKS